MKRKLALVIILSCLFSFIPIFNITYNISIPSFTKYQSKFSENFRSVDLYFEYFCCKESCIISCILCTKRYNSISTNK